MSTVGLDPEHRECVGKTQLTLAACNMSGGLAMLLSLLHMSEQEHDIDSSQRTAVQESLETIVHSASMCKSHNA